MRRGTRRDAVAWLLCAGLTLACDRPRTPKGPLARAELGVFFGGQVQERSEIPFNLDRTQQTLGFRLTFREPLPRPAEVRWEIDRPAPSKGPRGRGRGRAVEMGDAHVRVGQTVFDREIVLRAGDPLGTWNIRVVVDGEVAIDRTLSIYDAQARRQERASLMKQKR